MKGALLPVLTLLAAASAGPVRRQFPGPPGNPSSSNWPLPHNVTGDSDPSQEGGIYAQDPSIIVGPDGNYYAFNTHNLIAISSAPSLDGPWTRLGSVLNGASAIDLPGNNDIWAPNAYKDGDTYYIYYAVSVFGTQNSAVGVATSTTLLPGSWTERTALFVSNGAPGEEQPWPLNISNAIDPSVIEADDGVWLNYGSYWTDIWQFKFQDGDYLKIDFNTAPHHLSYEPNGNHEEEGSFMHYQNGWYYLWYSYGQCCKFDPSNLPAPGAEYSISVGRSRSPHGPFVDQQGTDLLNGGGTTVYGSHDYVYAPGGQGVLKDYNGRDVLYYHYLNRNVGYGEGQKLLGWNYIDYVDDWPVLSY